MSNALNYFIEANLYLICFYLTYQIILAKDKHFRFNRAFLLGSILFSLTLPFISFSLNPISETTEIFEGYIMLPAITIASAQTESIGFINKWLDIIGIIYISGLVFYLIRLFYQLFQIFKSLLFFRAYKEQKEGYTLIKTDGKIPTCSFFGFLFWDKSVVLSKEEKNQILEHELVHIKQLHSLDILIIGLLRAFFWFNPVIHLIKSNITEVHEYLADHYATREIGIEDYSKLLTLQVFKSFDFAISNNFHKSQVVKRIRMLKSNRTRSLWLNIGLLIPVLTLLITVLSYDVSGIERLNEGELDALESLTESTLNNEEIFTVVEHQPAPEGGMTKFYEYVQNNLKYPEEAKKSGLQGKVFVQFIVDKDGNLIEVQSVKGIGGGCDKEAIRVISESLPWNPGKQKGKNVKVRMIMPITFKLG